MANLASDLLMCQKNKKTSFKQLWPYFIVTTFALKQAVNIDFYFITGKFLIHSVKLSLKNNDNIGPSITFLCKLICSM